ncbi:Coiled-coil domain-containing protein [Dirofilaria immitis]
MVSKCTVLFFIIISTIDETDCTSLDIAVAFARYAGALFTFEEVIDIMPDVNKPLDNIADALRLSPLALAMANEFAYNLSTTLTTIAFDLIIFGYLIPSAIIILITILSCWYIREEIRNLYIMLVPFPIAKQACQKYLEKMDKKLIRKLTKQQEEQEKNAGLSGKYSDNFSIIIWQWKTTLILVSLQLADSF